MEEKEQFNQEMAESSKVYSLENIWFGLKRKRRDVVFDTTVQTFHSDSQVGKNCYVWKCSNFLKTFQVSKNKGPLFPTEVCTECPTRHVHWYIDWLIDIVTKISSLFFKLIAACKHQPNSSIHGIYKILKHKIGRPYWHVNAANYLKSKDDLQTFSPNCHMFRGCIFLSTWMFNRSNKIGLV